MRTPAGTSSVTPEAACSSPPQPAIARTVADSTARVRRSLRMGPCCRGSLEPDGVSVHAPCTVRLDQREAEREVLNRQAGGVEQRNPIRCGAPRVGTGEDLAELGDLVPRHETALHCAGELAPVARLSPVVAEELAPGHRRGLGLGLAGRVGAEHVEVKARPQVVLEHDWLVAWGHAGHDVAGERLLAGAHGPAELTRELARGLGVRVEADPGRVLRRGEAARGPGAVEAAADHPDA